MRLTLLILTICLFSCNIKTKTERQENCQSLDSINFELIKDSKDFMVFSEFILNNPFSNYFFNAIKLYDKTMMDFMDSIGGFPPSECRRNCASIDLKPDNTIAYEGMTIPISSIQDSLLAFLINKNNFHYLPEKLIIKDKDGNPHEISIGRVELQFVNDSCDYLQDIVFEINKSIKLYKNYLSKDWYSMDLNQLSKSNKELIDSLMTNRLILFGFDKYYILPPPTDYKYENQ